MITLTRLLALPWRFLSAYFYRIYDWISIFTTRHLRPAEKPGVRVERIKIPSRQGGRFIKAYKYTPTDLGTDKPSVHLNWHASGYLLKRIGLDHYRCYYLASRLKCVVFDCDYAKGPERLFPSATDDAEDAIYYVLARPESFDVSRISVGGSSAGGCIALVMSALFGRDRIKGCFSLYPVTKMVPIKSMDEDKPQLNSKWRSGLVISNALFSAFINAYFRSDSEFNDQRASPILLDVSRLPDNVLVACGDADTLYVDGKRMVEKIHSQGSDAQRTHTRFLSIPGEAHEFNNFPIVQESAEWRDRLYDAAVECLRPVHLS